MNKRPRSHAFENDDDKPTIITPVLMESSDNSFIETVDNRIYFYSDIDTDKVLKLNKSLREMSGNLATQQAKLSLEDPLPIYLHINSFGGYIFDGLSAMDEILQCSSPVITIVDGACASAATFLSVVGTHRQMKRNSFLLIHQLSTVHWGKFSELQDDMKNSELLMETIRRIYKEYTKVPKTKLDEILKHDLWWDAETALNYGMIDEII